MYTFPRPLGSGIPKEVRGKTAHRMHFLSDSMSRNEKKKFELFETIISFEISKFCGKVSTGNS